MGGNNCKLGCGGSTAVSDSICKFDKKFSWIKKDYRTLDEVSEALKAKGLKSVNPILGFCFTQSKWTTEKSLHYIGNDPNDYEKVVSIIGRTLAAICGDNYIHCFGFGDATTIDTHVFSFYEDKKPCHGFEEVVERYRQIACQMRLADLKSFVRIVEMATSIASKKCDQHHILVMIADGPVTRSSDTEHGKLSDEEQQTVNAISKASKYPLSIILVGVGEKNANMMKGLESKIPHCTTFDNFQYVNYTDIMSRVPEGRREIEFTLAATKKLPNQVIAIEKLIASTRFTNNKAMEMDWDSTAPPIPVSGTPNQPL
ncbi:hypothetical protein MKW98_020170 [Papaver atlanticum]|uniref:Copine C-terminal domain-containing protein n=1 Tax=Papaver atlanticum TaxID=357466 RepID=A0AAD4SBX8_9MAGN|nr:hypothetical protein MKW98_020170 [Papaver atlanticum]